MMKITNLDSRIVIVTPVGKSIPLKLGEIVKAEIIDIFATGGITLKIKGSFITAKTKIPLQKGSVAFFRVLSKDNANTELVLQFKGYADESLSEQRYYHKDNAVNKILQELSATFLKEGRGAKDFSTVVEKILKALPFDIDIDFLPKDLKVQIQSMFQEQLESTDFFQVFLPFGWKELKDGEIAFKGGDRDAEGRTPYSCRINLDLKGLGKLTIIVLMLNKEFFVSFRIENDEFQSILRSHRDVLEDRFNESGLNLKAINFLDKGSSLEQLEKLESFEQIINIRV